MHPEPGFSEPAQNTAEKGKQTGKMARNKRQKTVKQSKMTSFEQK
jgi:hypothetical protein